MKKVLLSWSSGKDSTWALHLLRRDPEIQVAAMVTSFNSEANRVAMHAVRRELVELQAERTGLPLWAVDLPSPCSNAVYEERMSAVCQRAVSEGFAAVAFGDLFLQDIRDYRIRQLQGTGLEPLFPLWLIPTAELAREMIAAGVKATITCVDPSKLGLVPRRGRPLTLAAPPGTASVSERPGAERHSLAAQEVARSYVGCDFDDNFLADLPTGIDPCGENGEFHTFVHDAPPFSSPIAVRSGEVVERDGFVFADVLRA